MLRSFGTASGVIDEYRGSTWHCQMLSSHLQGDLQSVPLSRSAGRGGCLLLQLAAQLLGLPPAGGRSLRRPLAIPCQLLGVRPVQEERRLKGRVQGRAERGPGDCSLLLMIDGSFREDV